MKKQKKLNLKKIKIATVNTMHTLRGGGSDSCEDVTCDSRECPPDYTGDPCNTSHTTVHTRADSETCGAPRGTISEEIC